MSRIPVSVEELNLRYAYCSGIAPEQITLCAENRLRVPFYRWDPSQQRVTKAGLLKYVYEYPLYKEWVEFKSVIRYTLRPDELVSEYVLFYKLRYSQDSGTVKLDTDFPFPVEISVGDWDVVIYPSSRVIGKYVERTRWFLLFEEYGYEFVLDDA